MIKTAPISLMLTLATVPNQASSESIASAELQHSLVSVLITCRAAYLAAAERHAGTPLEAEYLEDAEVIEVAIRRAIPETESGVTDRMLDDADVLGWTSDKCDKKFAVVSRITRKKNADDPENSQTGPD